MMLVIFSSGVCVRCSITNQIHDESCLRTVLLLFFKQS